MYQKATIQLELRFGGTFTRKDPLSSSTSQSIQVIEVNVFIILQLLSKEIISLREPTPPSH